MSEIQTRQDFGQWTIIRVLGQSGIGTIGTSLDRCIIIFLQSKIRIYGHSFIQMFKIVLGTLLFGFQTSGFQTVTVYIVHCFSKSICALKRARLLSCSNYNQHFFLMIDQTCLKTFPSLRLGVFLHLETSRTQQLMNKLAIFHNYIFCVSN